MSDPASLALRPKETRMKRNTAVLVGKHWPNILCMKPRWGVKIFTSVDTWTETCFNVTRCKHDNDDKHDWPFAQNYHQNQNCVSLAMLWTLPEILLFNNLFKHLYVTTWRVRTFIFDIFGVNCDQIDIFFLFIIFFVFVTLYGFCLDLATFRFQGPLVRLIFSSF